MTTHRAQRNNNTLKVLDVLRKCNRCTISEIADYSRLSRLTVVKILEKLGRQEIVEPDGKAPGRIEGGRKPRLYHFHPLARYGLGILIGERSVCGRLVDLNIETVAEFRKTIDLEAKVDELLAAIDELLSTLVGNRSIARGSILGVGVGSQGVTDFERGIVLTSPHNPGWGSRLPLRDIVQQRLGTTMPVYVDNAVRFRTLAETTAGLLRNVQNAHVIHCAEGLIGGNILNSTIYRGVHNFAGSIGHMKVNVNDQEQCDCGGFGCFEMQVMPRRVMARVKSLRGKFPESSLVSGTDSRPDLSSFFSAAQAGDPLARAVMDETIEWFAIAIHNLILMFDPEMVVIQGSYARAGEYFLTALRERVGKISLINVPYQPAIECSTLDDEEAGTLGAASYVLLHAFE
ncbi:MAG TPA: ROK family transcriptional regulator [Spirochaetia bacterium]|nr:ROK family transcriptional regulator [Spirochaetia bacterium]